MQPHSACRMALVALATLSGLGCDRGDLARAAADAKAQGLRSITTSYVFDENGSQSPLADLLNDSFVIAATPVAGPAAQSTTRDYILTWHVLTVLYAFSVPRSRPAEECPQPPGTLAVRPGQVAVPVVSGTHVIDGVEITMKSNEGSIGFDGGVVHLLMTLRCVGGVVTLPQGQANVFVIDSQGRIRAQRAMLHPPAFVTEMLQIGTADALARRMRRIMSTRLVSSSRH
jgi:hypothetical protein